VLYVPSLLNPSFLETFCSLILEKAVYYNRKAAGELVNTLAGEMRLNGPDRYHVTILDRSAIVIAPDGTPHFVAPATAKSMAKLYVASKEGVLLYVGVTNQSMSVRLRGGLTADGGHGYHGYSWGKKNHTIYLDIWYLDGEGTKPADLETIEAEVVFLYRQESGQWPQEQTEIHFHPSSTIHRQCARQVINALKEE
jgi:hypothetical protein